MRELSKVQRRRRAAGLCICGCGKRLPHRKRVYTGPHGGWRKVPDPRALYASRACNSRVRRWRQQQKADAESLLKLAQEFEGEAGALLKKAKRLRSKAAELHEVQNGQLSLVELVAVGA